METRDQWYKPNLLYNIHYRAPKKPESPKMIVETVRFNPSVCTCGEHGCQPQYRMEKRVLWTNNEAVSAGQEPIIHEKEKIDVNEESDDVVYMRSSARKKGLKEDGVNKMKEEMMMKEGKGGNECDVKVGNGFNYGTAENKKGYDGYFIVDNGYIKSKGDVDDGMSDIACNDVGDCSDRNRVDIGSGDVDETRRSYCNGNSARGKRKEDVSVYKDWDKHSYTGNGFNNDCNGKERSDTDERPDEKYLTGQDDRVDDENGDMDDEREYCSEYSDVSMNAEVNEENSRCKDEEWEEAEISSSFGIMSVYCNSEIHSWKRKDDADYR